MSDLEHPDITFCLQEGHPPERQVKRQPTPPMRKWKFECVIEAPRDQMAQEVTLDRLAQAVRCAGIHEFQLAEVQTQEELIR